MVVEGSIFNGDFVTDLRLSLLVKIFSNVGHRLSKLLATVWWHIFSSYVVSVVPVFELPFTQAVIGELEHSCLNVGSFCMLHCSAVCSAGA